MKISKNSQWDIFSSWLITTFTFWLGKEQKQKTKKKLLKQPQLTHYGEKSIWKAFLQLFRIDENGNGDWVLFYLGKHIKAIQLDLYVFSKNVRT